MTTKTAHVGVWAVKEMEEIKVHLGTSANWDEPAPVEQLPEDEEYYLTQLQQFVSERVDGETLFGELTKYEPTLVGEFTINADGEVLSQSMKV